MSFSYCRNVVTSAFVISLLLLSQIASAQDFAGTYTGDGLTLSLQINPLARDAYTGSINLRGQNFPARGTVDPAKGFVGEFDAAGAKFAFTLTRGANGLVLVSEGTTYQLKAQTPAVANPLAQNPASPNPIANLPIQNPAGPNAPAPGNQAMIPQGMSRPPLPIEGGAAPGNLSAIFKPGMRLTYHGGDSIVSGVGSQLVPNPDGTGGYVDPGTGQTYDDKPTNNSGGVGYVQVNVLTAKPDFVALNIENFLITDLQRGLVSAVGAGEAVGNVSAVGDFWVNPALLAQLKPQRSPGLNIIRLPYPLNGKTYNAIAIDNRFKNGYARNTYDTESGLLIFASSAIEGESVWTPTGGGQVEAGKGAKVISHLQLMGMREVRIPWANTPAPPWAARGRALVFQGGYSLNSGMGALPLLGMGLSFEFTDASNDTVVTRTTVRTELGRGLPMQEKTEVRRYGSAMTNPLWISPGALRQLQPNTVIDEDPLTKVRTVFLGVQGNAAMMMEQTTGTTTQNAYDLQTGMLMSINTTKQMAVGQVQYQLQLVPQR